MLMRNVTMRTILVATCLLALSIHGEPTKQSEMAKKRCLAASEESQRLFDDAMAHSGEKERLARSRVAAKHAYDICMDRDVPVEMQSEATVDYSRSFGSGDPSAALNLLKKTLRNIEATEGPDSRAVLPLIEEIASDYSNAPSTRRESLELSERALRIRRSVFGERSVETAYGLVALGTFWRIEEMPDRNVALAESYYREAIDIARDACGSNCEVLRLGLGMLQSLIQEQPARREEAAELEEQVEALYYEARTSTQ